MNTSSWWFKKWNSYWQFVKITSGISVLITKTCLYNLDPLKPHFYVVKLGFTGVYVIFLISAQNIDCGYSLEPPRRGGSNEYHNLCFGAEIWKISELFIWKFSFFSGKTVYLNRRVFVMLTSSSCLRVIGLLPSDHEQSRETPEICYSSFSWWMYFMQYAWMRQFYAHQQGFKIILAHWNAHVFIIAFMV